MANASPFPFGAQTASPGRQTIALWGDGGDTMLALGELLTDIERKAHIVHVVLDNGGLEFVKSTNRKQSSCPSESSSIISPSPPSPRRSARKASA